MIPGCRVYRSSNFPKFDRSGYEADSDLVQQCLDIGKVPYGEGDQYALPFSGNVMFLFYNKDLVSDVPTDWKLSCSCRAGSSRW